MIILITGASHTGKTLLAQRMLEKYRCPYFSIDHLKMGLIRSGNTSLTPLDDDALTDYLWPIVREIIKTAIENRQNLIVEGCYVPFDWRKDFAEDYLTDIRFICLAMTDDYIDKHFVDIVGNRSAIESRLDDSDCTVSKLKKDNRRCGVGFLQTGEQVTWIDECFEQAHVELLNAEFRPLRRIKQAATHQECEAVLLSAQRGILAVHGENGYPYGLPVNYLYLDGKIYFHCAKAGHKLDAVRANDKVCFTVLSEPVKNPGEWWNCFTSVICFGRITEVTEAQGKDRLLRQIGAKYFPEGYDLEKDMANNARNALILEITIDHMSGKHVREK